MPEHLFDETSEPKSETEATAKPLSFRLVITILAVPLVLILLNTVSDLLLPETSLVRIWISFIGHPFTALTIAALLSFYFLGIRRGYSAREVQKFATNSLEPVGLIIW